MTTTTNQRFNLSTRTKATGRIKGMSHRSPLNLTVDAVLHLGNAEEIAALKVAIAERLVEAETNRDQNRRRFNRTNTRNAANALVNAETVVAALTAAARRLA